MKMICFFFSLHHLVGIGIHYLVFCISPLLVVNEIDFPLEIKRRKIQFAWKLDYLIYTNAVNKLVISAVGKWLNVLFFFWSPKYVTIKSTFSSSPLATKFEPRVFNESKVYIQLVIGHFSVPLAFISRRKMNNDCKVIAPKNY